MIFLDNFYKLHQSLQLTFVFYLLAFIAFITLLITKKRFFAVIAFLLLLSGFLCNTYLLIHRWVDSGRPPFKTLYETLLFLPWCIAMVYFFILLTYRLWFIGSLICIGALLALVYAIAKPDLEYVLLPPALQSVWFIPHVVIYFIAYAGFFIACVMAMLSLIFPNWKSQDRNIGFEGYTQHITSFGFITLTLGLLLGAIWGKQAWGDYWSWDPKENWALITWLVYLIALHLRYIVVWRGKRWALVNIAGFCAVMFTYLGMHLLPAAEKSLHVYQ